MKKTLIASAVAAAALSTSVSAMQPASDLAAKLDSMPTVYGNIQLATSYSDAEVKTDGAKYSESAYEMLDNGSTIGFKHSHEIAPGVTGYLKAEFEFNADDAKGSNGGLNDGDQHYIGIKGEYGDLRAGSYDTIYNDAIDDSVADLFEFFGTYNHVTTSEKDQIKYTSPSMSGFSAALALQINGEYDGAKNGSGNGRNPVQGVVMYSVDNLSLALAADSADNSDKKTAYGLSATYAMGDLGLGTSVSYQDEQSTIYSVSGTYAMGANDFKAAFQYVDYEDEGVAEFDFDDQTNPSAAPGLGQRDAGYAFTVSAIHNLSDFMYVWAEAQYISDDADDKSNGDFDYEATTGAMGWTYIC